MKWLKRILEWTVTLILAFLVISATFMAVSSRRSPDALPTVYGHKVLTVLSGSMAPAIRTGDVILVRPLAKGDLAQEGDVITYRSPNNIRTLITHRVMGQVLVNGQVQAYVTKGDANASQDLATVSPLQVVGRYRWRIPFAGYVLDFIKKPIGTVLIVVVPGLTLVCMEFWRLWKLLSEAEAAKSAGNHER